VLLATRHVGAVAFLLIQHKQHFGQRHITDITVFKDQSGVHSLAMWIGDVGEGQSQVEPAVAKARL
jgi:hypothetical protein